MSSKRIIVTAYEPAGIGPDLVLALSAQDWPHQLVVCADKALLAQRATQLGIQVKLLDYQRDNPVQAQQAGTLLVEHIPLAEPVVVGQLNPANGHYVLKTLERAAKGCMNGEFDAIVTKPCAQGGDQPCGGGFQRSYRIFC